MLFGQGGPARGAPAARAGVPRAARPAQGHSIGNAQRFLPFRSPQTASPFAKFRLNFILLEFVLQRETGAVILEHPLEVRGALFLDLAEVFVGVEHVRLGFDHSHGDIGAVVGDPLEVR